MISILIPIYNGIQFIEDSVSSVLNQTFDKWEIIIGVNGHPENSQVYQIAKFFEREGKIKVLDLWKIKGKSNALNEMIKYCSFDYVAMLDVDDIWHEEKLEIQSASLNKYDVIGSKCVYFGDLEGIIPDIPTGDVSHFNFLSVNPIMNSSSIIRKSLASWDPSLDVEDYDLWLKLWKEKRKFYNYKEVLVRHRIHKESAFNSKGNHNKVPELLKKYSQFEK